jgi:hypothetical protein
MSFPLKQYSKYADFSLSHGLISQQVKDQMDATYKQCDALLRSYESFLFCFFSCLTLAPPVATRVRGQCATVC